MISSARSFTLASVMFMALVLPAPAYRVRASDITVDTNCSLADAIQAAESDSVSGGCPAGSDADTIYLTGDVTLDWHLPSIESTLAIVGDGYSIKGSSRHRILSISEQGVVTLSNVTLRGGNTDSGGAVWNAGVLTIHNSAFLNNEAYKNHGGAIFNVGQLDITDSIFENNRADRQGDSTSSGGAIYNEGSESSSGELTVNNTTFRGNWAEWSGGAIANNAGVITVTNSVFEDNKSDLSGGALDNTGELTVINTVFSRNSSNWGGAIDSNRGEANIKGSLLAENTAKYSGGAIDNSADISVIDSLFTDNSADTAGGAIYNDNATLAVYGSRFSGNSAKSGGAINSTDDIMSEHAQLSIEDSSFVANSAEMGGAVFATGVQNIRRSSFTANISTRFGGAMANFARELTISDSTFARNRSEFGGGGLALSVADAASLVHLTIANNDASEGAGIYVAEGSESTVTLHNSLLAGNAGGDCFAGALGASAGNLIADGSCDPAISADPKLGALVEPEDGSPAYYPLLPESPAIDAAHPEHCTETDQAGTPRPQGDACDIGAYEVMRE